MHFPLRRIARHLVAAVLVTVVGAALLPGAPATAQTVRYDNRLFGVHDSGLGSLGHGTVGSLRLWDSGTTWREIEKSPGAYDFSRLDQIVSAAQARNVEVTLVLGMTPDFYATGGGGATSMPSDLGAWTRYVTAVVNRYKSWNGRRGIAAYQVWNEANVRNFWTGSPMQMAQLTRATWHAVKGADKGAVVVGPAFAARIAEQTRGIGLFFQIKLSGRPVWRYMDVISLNLYPLDKYGSKLGTPETSMSLLAKTRKRMRLWGRVPASKPIWNTEVNYGMRTGTYGGTKAVGISVERQAAYVVRTYLLNAARGVKRVHWYTWNMSFLPAGGTLGNTLLTNPSDGSTLTLAGRAFGLVRGWMAGGKLVGASKKAPPCAADKRGTYTCIIKYRGGVKRIYWNPNKKVKIKAPDGAKDMVGVYGKRSRVEGGKSIRVDYRPVMVRSKR
jgi:hypothetical protein